MKQRVGVFGGSFDPPHMGHSTVARALITHKIVDEVWFIPVKQHPLGKQVTQENHRLEMLKLLLSHQLSEITPENVCKINDVELQRSGPSYSLKTLRTLAEEYPDIEFSWVMGSDNLSSFNTWWKYEELLEEFEVLVYPRAGYGPEPWYTQMSWLSEVPIIEISSTDVRKKIKEHDPIEELVGKEIATYIREHDLYH